MGNCNQPSPNLALCLLRLVLISGSLDLTRATRFWLHSFAALEGWGQYPITGAVCCGDIPRYSYTPLTRARLKPTSIHQTNIYALYVCIIYIYIYMYIMYTCICIYIYIHVITCTHMYTLCISPTKWQFHTSISCPSEDLLRANTRRGVGFGKLDSE